MNRSKLVPFPYDPPTPAPESAKPRLMRVEREGPVLVIPRPRGVASIEELRLEPGGSLRSVVRRMRRSIRRLQSRLMRGPEKPDLIKRSGD